MVFPCFGSHCFRESIWICKSFYIDDIFLMYNALLWPNLTNLQYTLLNFTIMILYIFFFPVKVRIYWFLVACTQYSIVMYSLRMSRLIIIVLLVAKRRFLYLFPTRAITSLYVHTMLTKGSIHNVFYDFKKDTYD